MKKHDGIRKDVETVITNIFLVKKVEENMTIMKEMEDIKKTQMG